MPLSRLRENEEFLEVFPALNMKYIFFTINVVTVLAGHYLLFLASAVFILS